MPSSVIGYVGEVDPVELSGGFTRWLWVETECIEEGEAVGEAKVEGDCGWVLVKVVCYTGKVNIEDFNRREADRRCRRGASHWTHPAPSSAQKGCRVLCSKAGGIGTEAGEILERVCGIVPAAAPYLRQSQDHLCKASHLPWRKFQSRIPHGHVDLPLFPDIIPHALCPFLPPFLSAK